MKRDIAQKTTERTVWKLKMMQGAFQIVAKPYLCIILKQNDLSNKKTTKNLYLITLFYLFLRKNILMTVQGQCQKSIIRYKLSVSAAFTRLFC